MLDEPSSALAAELQDAHVFAARLLERQILAELGDEAVREAHLHLFGAHVIARIDERRVVRLRCEQPRNQDRRYENVRVHHEGAATKNVARQPQRVEAVRLAVALVVNVRHARTEMVVKHMVFVAGHHGNAADARDRQRVDLPIDQRAAGNAQKGFRALGRQRAHARSVTGSEDDGIGWR